MLFCLSTTLAGDDFVGGIQNVTFPAISVDDFDNVSIACTEFIILEDKLAFEEVESFNVSLLPLEISDEFSVQFGENTSVTVEISDNDCELLGFLSLFPPPPPIHSHSLTLPPSVSLSLFRLLSCPFTHMHSHTCI